MSYKRILKCVKHPKYKGIREPKAACQACYWVYVGNNK